MTRKDHSEVSNQLVSAVILICTIVRRERVGIDGMGVGKGSVGDALREN